MFDNLQKREKRIGIKSATTILTEVLQGCYLNIANEKIDTIPKLPL